MTILIIGLALVVSHFAGVALQGPKHRVIHACFWRVRNLLNFPGGIVLGIMLPALLVAAVEWYLWTQGRILAGFLFSTFVFVLSWGSRDLDGDVKDYLESEPGPERDEARQQLVFDYRNPPDRDPTSEVVRGVFYQGLVRWFGTMFWFLVAGSGGALAFRLTQSLLCESRSRELLTTEQQQLLNRWVALVDLPPAILATLALAVVGDFDRVLSAGRKFFAEGGSIIQWDCHLYPEIGRATAVDGQTLDDAFAHDYAGELGHVNAAMSLVWRILVSWLTVIALIQLTALLN